jgi:hypothetical protein
MRKTVLVITIWALVVSLYGSVFPALAIGQEGRPPIWIYEVRRMNTKLDSGYYHLKSWHVTGNKKSVAFIHAFPMAIVGDVPRITSLLSLEINHRGKCSSPKELWKGVDTDLLDVKAVWFEEGSSAPTTDQAGLIFIAYAKDKDYSKLVVAAAGFDVSGQLTAPFSDIFEITPPAGETPDEFHLAAGQRLGAVGLFCSVVYYRFEPGVYIGCTSSEGLFLEVGTDGKPLGSPPASYLPAEIKLRNQGKLQRLVIYDPVWTGKDWFAPAVISNFKLDTSGSYDRTVSSANSLLTLIVQPKGPGQAKSKLRKLSQDAEPETGSFISPALVTVPQQGEAGAASGNSYLMAYAHREAIPTAERKMEIFDFRYYLQQLSDKGKKSGAVIEVELPEWNHHLVYDPSGMPFSDVKTISNPFVYSDGRLWLTYSRFHLADGRL